MIQFGSGDVAPSMKVRAVEIVEGSEIVCQVLIEHEPPAVVAQSGVRRTPSGRD